MQVIIRTTGNMKSFNPKKGRYSPAELQEAVNGLVRMFHISHLKAYMVINDEGGLLDLPINRMASKIYRQEMGKGAALILGDVLVCDEDKIESA